MATRGNDAAGPLLAAARRLETMNIDLARETYMDAFTASLFGARLNELVDVRDVAAAARAAPRSRADDPSAVDLLLDAFTAITGDYEQAVPVCRAAVRRLQLDRRSPGGRAALVLARHGPRPGAVGRRERLPPLGAPHAGSPGMPVR